MKFVQRSSDLINIRAISEPTKDDEDDIETVQGFIEHRLYPVFGGELFPSKQFQKLYWKQIQKYL